MRSVFLELLTKLKEMQPHPDVITLVLGELGGHGETGDGHGGGVGGEVGAHG